MLILLKDKTETFLVKLNEKLKLGINVRIIIMFRSANMTVSV